MKYARATFEYIQLKLTELKGLCWESLHHVCSKGFYDTRKNIVNSLMVKYLLIYLVPRL